LPRFDQYYKSQYGKTAVEVIKSETRGHFSQLLVEAVQPEPVIAAQSLNAAMKNMGTNEQLLINTLVGRSNAELMVIKQAYQALYKQDLEAAIKSEVGGDFERFFVVLLQASRDERGENLNVDADVEAFYRAGAGKIGTDETEFIRLICNRHYDHLARVMVAYAQKYGHTLAKDIKKEFSGHIEKVLVAMCDFIENRPAYFAKLLEATMSGIGTNEEQLNRLVLRLRATPLMPAVKGAFLQLYGKSLDERIKGETSGDHEKLLLALVNQGIRA
jgi:hypothetical protein